MIGSFKGSSRLRREIGEWVEHGIITREQALVLHERYELDKEVPWYQQSGFILRALALLLAGMALFLLISQNWDDLPIWARVSTGAVPLLVAYGCGFYFRATERVEQSELAFFFASLAFGGNIFLQAQIFHISEYYPAGLLWWALGALPLALYFSSSLHNALVNVVVFFWLSMQIEYEHFSWVAPVLIAGILYVLYRQPSRLVLLMAMVNIYMLLFNIDGVLPHNLSGDFWLLFYAITALGMTASSFVRELCGADFAARLYNLQHLAALAVPFVFTFREFVSYAIPHSNPSPVSYVVLAAAFALYMLSVRSMRTFSVLLMALPLLGANILGLSGATWVADTYNAVSITMNLVVFGYAVWGMFWGLKHRSKRDFMGGVFVVVVLAMSRYMDYFDDYQMMSAVFFAGALFLWFVHWFWNRRVSAKTTAVP